MIEFKHMKRVFFCLISVLLICQSAPCYAFWIWTPKSGKLVNPKTVAKSSSQEQLSFARELFEANSLDEAGREFKKVLNTFPRSVEAAEAQYYLGRVAELQRKPYEAFQAYQKVIDKYPFSERSAEIIQRQYDIGEVFMSGEKRKAMGIDLPVEHPSVEIFAKVTENSPYGPLAAKAQYKLGLVLKSLQRFEEAQDAFYRVVKNYPESEWVEPAQYQLAESRAALSRGPDYDQAATQEAKERFEKYLQEHPDAVLSDEAQKNIDELRLKEAESCFNTGRFYEKQKASDAARLYYQEIIDEYPGSEWAARAMERLNIMEKKK